MTDPEHDAEARRRRQVAEAVRSHDLGGTEAWRDLSILSNETQVDTLEVFEDEIIGEEDGFSGPLLWHVTLNYGSGDDAVVASESFPGRFCAQLIDGAIVVTEMSADTSSYYE
jgi:hypothetical protein